MTHDGECFPLEMLAHDTSVKGAGLWPTPLTDCSTSQNHGRESVYAKARRIFGLSLIPACWEALMLWPVGWTNAEGPLATDKFRQWLRSHGASSPQNFQRLETRQA